MFGKKEEKTQRLASEKNRKIRDVYSLIGIGTGCELLPIHTLESVEGSPP